MRGSVIIYGSTQKARENKILEILESEFGQKFNWNYLENIADVKLIEPMEGKKSIGIAQAKEGTRFLQEKPFALDVKILILNKAEMLTIEAQNSLLKTLEEPPSYALILLMTKAESSLIPTVISRCKKIAASVGSSEDEETQKNPKWTLDYVLDLGIGERLDWVEEFSKEEREDIVEVLEVWVGAAKELMGQTPDEYYAYIIEKILGVLDDLENTHVGSRLALENLMVCLG